ncbi:thermostable hemolysin [Congregibacter litoralis]|uniref:Thermostable hemolysin n=1 Tax=Congregibacter litoralis KT71 TaxID=314285 RepID=A4A4X9_9GAMM|nr:thermostable hemolysin [Congregibacter litoralis]EAQ98850.1 Thermostable hemolysin [Congregibacter litoralis KT71]
MNNFVFSMVDAASEDYAASVEFALAAYGSSPLQSIRQAFPSYACMYRHAKLAAVCGVRGANRGLFLEQFMEERADDYIARHEGSPVARSAIAELGAFYARSPALVPMFATQIEKMLGGQGYSHALVLSPSAAGTLADWCKERATMAVASDHRPGDPQEPKTLKVSVIALDA